MKIIDCRNNFFGVSSPGTLKHNLLRNQGLENWGTGSSLNGTLRQKANAVYDHESPDKETK